MTVVIPTYNRAPLLRRTLSSVLAQTVAPLEVLVADDGSTDDTAAAIREFGGRVTHLLLPHVGAPAAARNAGLARARGDWIAFVDDDDLWMADKLERQLALAEGVGLVCCNAELIDERDHPIGRNLHEAHPLAKEPDPLRALIGGNFVVCSSVLARTELLRASGGFYEGPELGRLAEDYDLWLRCALRARLRYEHEPWVRYRFAGTGLSQGTPSLRQAEALATVRRRLIAALGPRADNEFAEPLRQNWRRLQHARYKAYLAEGPRWRAFAPWLAVQAAKARGRR
ncbi:MAG TPA: glycosyltransferase family A protein [Verrucomicrobiae bacterium]|nr:glycosyltransferase family A protein [Verrucomicrobiae bacterium]